MSADLRYKFRRNLRDAMTGTSMLRNGSKKLIFGRGLECSVTSGNYISAAKLLHNSSAVHSLTATISLIPCGDKLNLATPHYLPGKTLHFDVLRRRLQQNKRAARAFKVGNALCNLLRRADHT